MRKLVVNADDFGASTGTNKGILAAHAQGIVTSTSLMVRGPAAAEAADCIHHHPSLGIGLHVDLGEWIYQDMQWRQRYHVVDIANPAAVASEVERQYSQFVKIVGKPPTHIDSHQHVHRQNPARDIVIALGHRLRIPVRHFTPGVQYVGLFYGQSDKGYPYPQGITADALISAIEQLAPGVSELGCHPGLDAELESTYCSQRLDEVRSLCDPKVRAALIAAGIELCSFADCHL
jgi:predicted glycoside hydrolase/deacetylase ChbG (UPF0249 family)